MISTALIRDEEHASELSCCGVWVKSSFGVTVLQVDSRLDLLHGSHREVKSREADLPQRKNFLRILF